MPKINSLFEIGDRKTWMMPQFTGLNKLSPHSFHFPFATRGEALTNDHLVSPWFLNLNGEWDFKIAPYPEYVTDEFISNASWFRIQIPGNWTMQGFGHPHYTNVIMPFPNNPPEVPHENPTGVYRRTFTLPGSWTGRRVVLHFGGCEGALYVSLNGKLIGLSKDSRSPAEFDITPIVNFNGSNELNAMVIQWSDASFLEDQDHWWQAGIQRDVFLYSTLIPYIYDIHAMGDLSEDYQDGILRIKVKIGLPGVCPENCIVEVQIYDPQQTPLLTTPLSSVFDSTKDIWHAPIFPANEANFEYKINHPLKWTAETPCLYTVVVTLKTPDGEESSSCKIGFRKIEICDRMLLVNGERIMIKGVNYHDHDDRTGKAISHQLFERDLHLMKRFNINAIRTSHYPKDPYFYDLCDWLGIYVIDEANIETHAYIQDLCRDLRYTNAFMERVQAMVERDKNHSCILLWSLGNESGYGPNHDAAAAYIRSVDQSRPLHYESALRGNQEEIPWQGGKNVTDIVCPMYPSIDKLVKWSENDTSNRPLILCEYSHCMGNSNGSLADYWDVFEKYNGIQGGFLWEWIDHGIIKIPADGKPYWAYGGDFCDLPNDANFCIDGIVWPDRKPHPALFEFKYLAQPFKVEWMDRKKGIIRIINKQDFINLNWLNASWELTKDGIVIAQGEIPELDIPAHDSKEYHLPIVNIAKGDGECFINFHFNQHNSTCWSPAGFEVGWQQLPVSSPFKRKINNIKTRSRLILPEIKSTDKSVKLYTERASIKFNKRTGELIEFGNHKNILVQGFYLNIWRAPVDNDGIKLLSDRAEESSKILAYWKNIGLPELKYRLKSFRIVNHPDQPATIEIIHLASGREKWDDFIHTHSYTLLPSGRLIINNHITVGNGIIDIPRIGVYCIIKPTFENLEWYGRGPWENYSDRKSSAMIANYTSSVTDQYIPYIMPQEHGHKTDIRWLKLIDTEGYGLKIDGFPTVEFSASHFSAHDLFIARHTNELIPKPEIWLNIDKVMRGLGTASCGPDTLEKYRILTSEHDLKFSVDLLP